MTGTIAWNASTTSSTLHMDTHNTYGSQQLEAVKTFYNSLTPDNVPFIFSASKSFKQTEPMLIENVDASWENLKQHMTHVLFSSISGNHFVALPVCGDTSSYNTTFHESLCMR